MNGEPRGGYAEVNGLNMYYEIHGAGQPRVVLHGAYMTIDAMGEVVPSLAETRRVIAVEPQLAVLPGTTHFVPPGNGVLDRADWLVAMIGKFLDAPTPETERAAGGGA